MSDVKRSSPGTRRLYSTTSSRTVTVSRSEVDLAVCVAMLMSGPIAERNRSTRHTFFDYDRVYRGLGAGAKSEPIMTVVTRARRQHVTYRRRTFLTARLLAGLPIGKERSKGVTGHALATPATDPEPHASPAVAISVAPTASTAPHRGQMQHEAGMVCRPTRPGFA